MVCKIINTVGPALQQQVNNTEVLPIAFKDQENTMYVHHPSRFDSFVHKNTSIKTSPFTTDSIGLFFQLNY